MHDALKSGHSIYVSQTSQTSHKLSDTPDDFEVNYIKNTIYHHAKKRKHKHFMLYS